MPFLWRNFQYNKSTDVYTLSITKFVDNSGKLISHALEESWEKYRTLPISTLLGKILEERKKFLIRKGLAAEVLENYPIILGREDLNKMLKGHKEEFCKPAVVAQKCRESIQKQRLHSTCSFYRMKKVELSWRQTLTVTAEIFLGQISRKSIKHSWIWPG